MAGKIRKGGAVILLGALALGAAACSEQGSGTQGADGASPDSSYPERAIEMVVAWSAGGGTDLTARALVQTAEEHLGAPIQVVNREGGSGAVGWGEIAHNTEPDGYTLSIVSPEIGFLEAQGVYDFGLDDFTLITLVNADPSALTVRADAPWDTVEEFVEDARENPGSIRVGNSGAGLLWHLAAVGLEQEAGVEFTHAPFDGAAPGVAALLAGDLDAVTFSSAEVSAQVEAGELKVLGVMTDERIDSMPDVPTMEEQGYPVHVSTFRGVAGPDGMDEAQVELLNDAFVKMAEEDVFTEMMANNNSGIRVMETQEFNTFFAEQADAYGEILESIG